MTTTFELIRNTALARAKRDYEKVATEIGDDRDNLLLDDYPSLTFVDLVSEETGRLDMRQIGSLFDQRPDLKDECWPLIQEVIQKAVIQSAEKEAIAYARALGIEYVPGHPREDQEMPPAFKVR